MQDIEHKIGYEEGEPENQIVIAEMNEDLPLVSDKDHQILSNIDMIIQNLQEQKGRFVQQSGLFDLPKHQLEKKGTDKI